jgi:hypothetical protein
MQGARLFLRALLILLLPSSVGIAACDLGSFESLSTDTATSGTDEVTLTARKFWTSYSAPEPEIAKLTADLEAILSRAGGEQLTVGALEKGANANVGLDKTIDASLAAGILLVAQIDCKLDEIDKLVIATNQPELYPEVYDAYKRTYKSSYQDYLARRTESLSWETDDTVSYLSRQYRSILNGGSRYLAHGGPGGKPVILSRTWLTAPPVLLKGSEFEFKQDYQIEVYYELSNGKTRHFYGVWRELRMGTITAASPLYQTFFLGNLSDADKHAGVICKSGSPQAKFD